MKIVLKDADFSQTGLPVPYEFVLTDGSMYGSVHGQYRNNVDNRSCDLNAIPIIYKEIVNKSSVAITLGILFYSSDFISTSEEEMDNAGNYIGCVGNSIYGTVTLQPGSSIRIDQQPNYVDGNGDAIQFTSDMKYYRIGVMQPSTGVILEANKV